MNPAWSRQHYAGLALIALACAYLLLINLAYPLPWNDEAILLFAAERLRETGAPSMWDGSNLIGYRNGFYLTEDLDHRYPLLPIMLAALSQMLFGVNDWSFRLLNVIFALLALALFALVLRRELPQRPIVALLAFALVALQPTFLTFMRQGVYYSYFMLANLGFYFCLRTWMLRERGGHAWLVGSVAAAFLSFFSNYFGIVWIFCCGLIVLAENWRRLDQRRFSQLAFAGGAFAAATVAHIFVAELYGNPQPWQYAHGWLFRKILLLKHTLTATSELDVLPWPLALVTLGFAGLLLWRIWRPAPAPAAATRRGKRKKPSKPKVNPLFATDALPGEWDPLLRHLALGAFTLFMLAIVSFESPVLAGGIDIRYRHFLMPYFCIAAALTMARVYALHPIGRVVAGACAAAMIFTNYLTYPAILHIAYKRTFPDLLYYIHQHHALTLDSHQAIIDAIGNLPKINDKRPLIAIQTDGKLEIATLVWKTRDSLLWCCQVDQYGYSLEQVRELGKDYLLRLDPEFKPERKASYARGRPFYYNKETEKLMQPHYIITFRKHMDELLELNYEVAEVLPLAYHYVYSRPEPRYRVYNEKELFSPRPGDQRQLVLLRHKGLRPQAEAG